MKKKYIINHKILVIIPTLNAAKELKQQIKLLKTQTNEVETLIIDSSSTDDTLKIAREQGIDTKLINRKDFNHATTRNIAKTYNADFYLFMTQDALPYDEFLVENLLKPFEDSDVVVSYAKQVPFKDADMIERFARETNYSDVSVVKSKESLSKLGIKTFFCSNSCAMYRATYFKDVGGFTEDLIMNEDMEFVARVILDDRNVAYVSDAKVWHSHEYVVGDIFKRYFDIGVFFKSTPWIKDEVNKYISTESTGIEQAKKEILYLLKNSPLSVPKSILFSFTKFIAFKLGYNYQKLPLKIARLCSLHKNFHNYAKILKREI